MIKNILLPVDGSEYTDAVLKYGIVLGKILKARVKVLSVVDIRIFEWALSVGSDGFVPIVPSGAYHEESRKLLETRAEAILDKCSKILEKEQLPFQAEMIPGSPIEVISEHAQLTDLLIMGNRGEYARWKSKMIGATLEAVTRQINKPFFITPKEYRELKTIQLSYDGSENSNRSLQLGGFLASQLNLSILVMTVADDEERGCSLCAEAEKYLEPFDISIKIEVVKGDVDSMILQCAYKNNVDVILMGAYGTSRFREAILGSTTAHIMRNATIPILLAK